MLKQLLILFVGLQGIHGFVLGTVTGALGGLGGSLPLPLPLPGAAAVPPVAATVPPVAATVPPVAGAVPPAAGVTPAAGTPTGSVPSPGSATTPGPVAPGPTPSPSEINAFIRQITTLFLNLVLIIIQAIVKLVVTITSFSPSRPSSLPAIPLQRPPQMQSDLPINAGFGPVAGNGRKRRNDMNNDIDSMIKTVYSLMKEANTALAQNSMDCLRKPLCELNQHIMGMINLLPEQLQSQLLGQLNYVRNMDETLKRTVFNANSDCYQYNCQYENMVR